jgi:NACHT domain
MDATQTPANSVKGKHSDQTAGRKRKGKNIVNAAYGQLANNVIVDEIDALEPSISPKRSCPADLLELAAEASERRKYIKEIITDINGSSNQYSNSVESANPLPGAVDQLSDPTFERTLPFPFIGSEVPVRFKVVEGTWQYVGRTKFKELLQELKKVRESDVYSTVWLYGTQGYGKSHLLAALVCYLAAQDERVVYISGCQALFNYPVKYLRATMLFAWADDITIQKLIITLNTLEDIGEFFESQKNVIFIIDQMDTLKINGSGEKGKRENLSDWIKRFTFGHKKVYSSSANDADYYEQAQNQYQSSMLPVYAGLTKVNYRKIMSQ